MPSVLLESTTSRCLIVARQIWHFWDPCKKLSLENTIIAAQNQTELNNIEVLQAPTWFPVKSHTYVSNFSLNEVCCWCGLQVSTLYLGAAWFYDSAELDRSLTRLTFSEKTVQQLLLFLLQIESNWCPNLSEVQVSNFTVLDRSSTNLTVLKSLQKTEYIKQ